MNTLPSNPLSVTPPTPSFIPDKIRHEADWVASPGPRPLSRREYSPRNILGRAEEVVVGADEELDLEADAFRRPVNLPFNARCLGQDPRPPNLTGSVDWGTFTPRTPGVITPLPQAILGDTGVLDVVSTTYPAYSVGQHSRTISPYLILCLRACTLIKTGSLPQTDLHSRPWLNPTLLTPSDR